MRLYSLTLNGFRRFEQSWINLEGRVVAIVGPNEAGKSSILAALEALDDEEPIPATAVSRGLTPAPDDELIYARFRLSPEERGMSETPLDDDEGIWLIVAKTLAGPRKFRLEPPAKRDKRARAKARLALEKTVGRPWRTGGATTPETDEVETLDDRLTRHGTDLESNNANLGSDVLNQLEGIQHSLLEVAVAAETSKTSRTQIERLARTLGEALVSERRPHPSVLAQTLKDRVPAFLDFDDRNRSLRSEYDLANPEHASAPALENLAAVAGLPLPALQDAIGANDVGRIRSLIEAAQDRLNQALTDAWKQSALTISFDRQGTVLRITVSSHGTDYFSLDDRSDGLRIFIALRVFLARRQHEVRPILLVDEAESHLHYDAQADIIRVFEQQAEVAQVVYTTHSIGCLPQDLGRGVRVVSPEEVGTRSQISNVWSRAGRASERRVGITPLMLAMGASTVPLTPTRFVVVAEGPSDALLLPSLLREATGLEVLGYQVVGGLSEASQDELGRMSLEAPRVAYLVDGDPGGREIERSLRSLGVPARRIVRWAGPATRICLEDAINPSLYVRALNEYLVSWPPHSAGIQESSLRKTGRPNQVKAWCFANGIKEPSKLLVAQEILNLVDDPAPHPQQRLTDSSRGALLRELHRKLASALDLPSSGAN